MTDHNLKTQYPILWERTLEVNYKRNMGFYMTDEDKEIANAIEELWLIRQNRAVHA